MSRYKILTPQNTKEALEHLRDNSKLRILAGGTDLVVHIKEDFLGDVDILDISKINELKRRSAWEGGLRIGALCTLGKISDDFLIKGNAPCLAQAASEVGSVQIRNRATIGGNIMNASPAADTVPALVVLGALAQIQSDEVNRELPIEELFLSPGRTVLEKDEILSGVFVPSQPTLSAATFMKLGRRKAQAISVTNLAVRVTLDDKKKRVLEARIALGSVAPTVIRIQDAEAFMQGAEIRQETIEKAAELVAMGINPITDIRASASYRRKASRALFIKAIAGAMEQLGVEM